nr:unnamed protein product [Digitaria exilis]
MNKARSSWFKDPDDCEVMRMAEFSRDAGGVMIVAEVAGPDVVGHRKSHDRRWQWQPRRDRLGRRHKDVTPTTS